MKNFNLLRTISIIIPGLLIFNSCNNAYEIESKIPQKDFEIISKTYSIAKVNGNSKSTIEDDCNQPVIQDVQ